MAYREAAECAIDEMPHAGIIEPSASPWASGVVMVKKKNTSKMRFCVDYRPLNKEKGADFTWAPECQQAFDLLKNALTEAPVLRPPDLSLPFVLDTDASNVGMGAVLSQGIASLFKTRPSQRPHRETVFWPPPGPDVHVVRGKCTVVHQQTGPPSLFQAHQNH
ncbi:hypothetical protein AAFF_G00192580 [Aldrovandia affinis]|uniref:Reverse transcriptase/retrotransposon-derived protein RNase H-like domain-containing protein n=1 Tax=Aldrovandia affinis TaxID=143900 RepID=A0AAD7RJQ5_9TELE|nr:hypothetical protein AAFF_G00192580 [Aldrovandia affinis]